MYIRINTYRYVYVQIFIQSVEVVALIAVICMYLYTHMGVQVNIRTYTYLYVFIHTQGVEVVARIAV